MVEPRRVTRSFPMYFAFPRMSLMFAIALRLQFSPRPVPPRRIRSASGERRSVRSVAPPVGPSLRGEAAPARDPASNAPVFLVGHAIRDARLARMLTQAHLGHLVGVDA